MIPLCIQNGKVFVYSTTDWECLRKNHRIVGLLCGNSQFTPALPAVLLPEEVALLVAKGVAKLVRYEPSQAAPDEHSKLQKQLLSAERKIYKENRRAELEQIIDKILEGKKRKSGGTAIATRDEILEEELNKSCDITEDTMLWPTFTESFECKPIEIPLDELLSHTSPIRCAVFADLWERGYYITAGMKFGGDFLVYLGDPVAFHAIFIVRCIEDPNFKLHTSEIVAFGRLGTSVKKRAVLASCQSNGSVSYITLNWLE